MNSRIAIGGLALATGLAIGCSRSRPDTGKIEAPDGYMYCKECGYERLALLGGEKGETQCPRCLENNRFLEFSRVSHKGRGIPWAVPTGLVLVAALAGGAIGYRYWKTEKRKKELPAIFNFTCPFCAKKLHYRGNRAGHVGACPRCRNVITFPGLPPASTDME
jgi:hypothetical protein